MPFMLKDAGQFHAGSRTFFYEPKDEYKVEKEPKNCSIPVMTHPLKRGIRWAIWKKFSF
jgi:hypothetical protein